MSIEMGIKKRMPWVLISTSVITKTRAFLYKSCQNISTTVGFTKIRAFMYKSCQNISTNVGFTKTRAFLYKSRQNCAILLYCNNISQARTSSTYVINVYYLCKPA